MKYTSSYRSYPEHVKNEVIRTGNIYLFPHLKIPRTTAQYWISPSSKTRRPRPEEIESLHLRRAKYLENELEKEKAMRRLLEKVRAIFPYDFKGKNVKSKSLRNQIVVAIREL